MHTVLDVGCGSGRTAILLCERDPDLQVVCIDRPDMLDKMNQRMEEKARNYKIIEKCRDIEKECFTDGGQYDAIILSNILHLFSEDTVRRILQACADALNPGGRILLNDIFYRKDNLETKLYMIKWMKLGTAFSSLERTKGMLDQLSLCICKEYPILNTPNTFFLLEK